MQTHKLTTATTANAAATPPSAAAAPVAAAAAAAAAAIISTCSVLLFWDTDLDQDPVDSVINRDSLPLQHWYTLEMPEDLDAPRLPHVCYPEESGLTQCSYGLNKSN